MLSKINLLSAQLFQTSSAALTSHFIILPCKVQRDLEISWSSGPVWFSLEYCIIILSSKNNHTQSKKPLLLSPLTLIKMSFWNLILLMNSKKIVFSDFQSAFSHRQLVPFWFCINVVFYPFHSFHIHKTLGFVILSVPNFQFAKLN